MIHYLGGSSSDLSHNVNSSTASAESSSGSPGAYSNAQALPHGSPQPLHYRASSCHPLSPLPPPPALYSSHCTQGQRASICFRGSALHCSLCLVHSPGLYVVWSLTPFSSCSNVLYQGGPSKRQQVKQPSPVSLAPMTWL